jgi:hypothetical protein
VNPIGVGLDGKKQPSTCNDKKCSRNAIDARSIDLKSDSNDIKSTQMKQRSVITLILLLSETQWCFSTCREAIMSNGMTERDCERGKIGSS